MPEVGAEADIIGQGSSNTDIREGEREGGQGEKERISQGGGIEGYIYP